MLEFSTDHNGQPLRTKRVGVTKGAANFGLETLTLVAKKPVLMVRLLEQHWLQGEVVQGVADVPLDCKSGGVSRVGDRPVPLREGREEMAMGRGFVTLALEISPSK